MAEHNGVVWIFDPSCQGKSEHQTAAEVGFDINVDLGGKGFWFLIMPIQSLNPKAEDLL